MKILFVSFFFPFPQDSGAKQRTASFLQNLAEAGHDVDLFSLVRSTDTSELLCSVCRKTFLQRNAGRRTWLAALISILFRLPFAIAQNFDQAMKERFCRILGEGEYDILFLDMLWSFEFVRDRTIPRARVVVNEHNNEGAFLRQMFRRERNLVKKVVRYLDFAFTQRYEANALETADCVVHVSEADRQLSAHAKFDTKSVVIQNTLARNPARTNDLFSKRFDLVFVGTPDYLPNSKGIEWFLSEVWGALKEEFPSLSLAIVGKGKWRLARRHLQLPGVFVLGYVPEIDQVYFQSRIAIAPVLAGGGSRLKIIEAFSMGVPVIATAKGAEGLDEALDAIVVAGTTNEWVSAVRRLLDEDGFYEEQVQKGLALFDRLYCYRAIRAKVDSVIDYCALV